MDDRGERACGVTSIVLCAVNGFSLVLGTAGFLLVRRVWVELCADFGTRLPLPTRLLLAPPGWAIVLVMAVLLGLLIAKEWMVPRWKALILNVAWLLSGMVVVVVLLLALCLPLLKATMAVPAGNNPPPPAEEAL